MHPFSLEYGTDTDVHNTEIGVIPRGRINWFTESLRLMVPNSSNQMTSLAGSEFKMEEDHLNINIARALLFFIAAHEIHFLDGNN